MLERGLQVAAADGVRHDQRHDREQPGPVPTELRGDVAAGEQEPGSHPSAAACSRRSRTTPTSAAAPEHAESQTIAARDPALVLRIRADEREREEDEPDHGGRTATGRGG